ncbi:MAG: hypothetical protein AB8F78_02145 [Saprospiraceae bacterium]
MKIRINRLPKHASFNYAPRYYDPEKERIQNLKADYTEGDVADKLKNQIRQGFGRTTGQSSQFNFRKQHTAQTKARNKRLWLIIIGFLVIGYLVLESNVEGLIAALGVQ